MKEIKLTQGKVALVDDEDFEEMNKHKWHAVRKSAGGIYYAAKYNPSTKGSVLMHRFILNITDPKVIVDHIDHNGLNNQRNNIRLTNHSGNGCNRRPNRIAKSKYLGVTHNYKSWVAQIHKNGHTKILGQFDLESEAALAYNEAATKLHGEFANLNKISEELESKTFKSKKRAKDPRHIEGSNWIEISNTTLIINPDGRVYCTKNQQYRKASDGRGGLYIAIRMGGKIKNTYIHKLLAEAFIPNPNNLPIVKHKDRNRLNNSLDNLKWCSHRNSRL